MAEDGQEGEQHEDWQAPNEDVLRSYWEAAKELLAYAKKQGYAEGHPVRDNAQRQVDAAYADWRAATPPKAVHARMGWAEDALRRARRAQARAEQELDDLDRNYEIERERKLRTLEEAREKTRERVQKLADLSREAAEEYRAEPSGEGADLIRGTFRTLDTEVGPAVEAVLAKLDQGSELYGILQPALRTITTMHAALAAAAGGSSADFFDIAAGDDSAEPPTTAAQMAGASAEGGPEDMDTTDARAPRWLEPKRGGEPDPVSTTGALPPRWKKYRTGDKGDDQPTAARGEAGSGAAGSGGPAPPTTTAAPTAAPPAEGEQRDEFQQRRDQIVAQASFDGIDVPADYLRQLCPEALEEWAREHLL